MNQSYQRKLYAIASGAAKNPVSGDVDERAAKADKFANKSKVIRHLKSDSICTNSTRVAPPLFFACERPGTHQISRNLFGI